MKNSQTLKEYYTTMERHDWERMRSLLCDDLQFRGPLMETHNADQLISAIKEFACEVHFSRVEMIETENTVMSFFTFHIAQPFTGEFRMAERAEFRGGKIASSELIYDPRKFPNGN